MSREPARIRRKRKHAALWLRRRQHDDAGSASWQSSEGADDPGPAALDGPSAVRMWWHVYGGTVPGLVVEGDDPFQVGVNGPTIGPSWTVPEGSDEPYCRQVMPGHDGAPLRYLDSFDHPPTTADIDGVTPEQYRASEGARTEPLPDGD